MLIYPQPLKISLTTWDLNLIIYGPEPFKSVNPSFWYKTYLSSIKKKKKTYLSLRELLVP